MINHEKNLARERRERAAKIRLGSANPRCATCGIDDLTCLEAHHIAGRAYDPTTCISCRNCHRRLSDNQKDAAEQKADPPSSEEVLAHFLLGMADLFELLVERLREFAREIIERISGNRGEKP